MFSQDLSGESGGVWDQGPGVALGLGFFQDICQAIEEGVAVLVITEDLSSFYPPGHDVLQEARGVKSGLAWHLYSYRVLREHREIYDCAKTMIVIIPFHLSLSLLFPSLHPLGQGDHPQ